MNLINRVKNILLTPDKEWDVINGEQPNTPGIITGYVLPLAGAAALAGFLGHLMFGWWGMKWALMNAIITLIMALLNVLISSFVIDALAPSFGAEKNLGRSVQLVSYSLTPAWIGGLLAIVPILGSVGAIAGGLYGLYLLYLGLPKLKKATEDKKVGYLVVSIVVIVAVYIILYSILTTVILRSMGFGFGRINISM